MPSSSGRPLVVVTAGANSPRRVDLYMAGVEAAGARGAVVRPGDEIPPFDALLLTGGPDVDPNRYGQEPDAMLGTVDAQRDALELAIFDDARRRRVPILAICRGMQLVNVALGGTLIQHVDGHEQSAIPEMDIPGHRVEITGGTRLARLAGADELDVNSYHHQVIDRLAPHLQANARDAQGVVEGFETPDGSILAVQCHPERMLGSPWARALFADLVRRARVSISS